MTRPKYIAAVLGLAAVYIVAAKLGLSLAYTTKQVTTVWPPTGIALAVLLLGGRRLWPGVFIGALVSNYLTHEPLWVAIGIAIGNTLEAYLGATWLRQFRGWRDQLDRIRDVFALLIYAGLFATAVSATFGISSLMLGGLLSSQAAFSAWITWWFGDMAGALIIAPLILIWSNSTARKRLGKSTIETVILFVMLSRLTFVIFTRNVHQQVLLVPAYLIPYVIWAALRLRQIGSVTATMLIAVVAVIGTTHGLGPFSVQSQVEVNLLLLQVFMLVISMTGLVLSAAVSERDQAEADLREDRTELRLVNERLQQALSSGKHNEQHLSQTVKELERTKKAMMNIMEDLEHDRASTAKEQSQDEAMLMAIGDGLVVIDEDAKVVLVNEAFEHLTGWSGQEALGKPIFEVLPAQNEHGDAVANDRRPYTKVLETGKTVTTRLDAAPYYYVRKNGERFPVAITVTPMMLGGKIAGTVNVFRDITHELDMNRAKSEFVSLASHELRTPLTIVRWSIDMLKRYTGKLNPAQLKYVNAIEQTGLDMVNLVDALLNVSRIEMGTLMIEPEPTKLDELLSKVLTEFQPLIASKRLRIRQSVPPSLPSIRLDRQLVRMAITNLLTNAIKYTPAGGQITIEIEIESDRVVVTVTDTGYGIPTKEQPRIFEKLFRADNIKEFEPHGTGLGLYIARAVVEQSGGKMWFESEENRGSSFHFWLPRTGVAARAGSKTLQTSSPSPKLPT